jgi:hypothetical protein
VRQQIELQVEVMKRRRFEMLCVGPTLMQRNTGLSAVK